ncbi:glycosyltransferase family 39 protein [Kineosporia sp. R_H_3]|uniref:glycosyltransferase family 39 protein n=1 Tax=Kineosporia sp. R_H_3 TaxID=1961848 RepID=UPI0013042665|nr:glycosyltransferase family 39 protein [Kineosporia sp. R_H_3]
MAGLICGIALAFLHGRDADVDEAYTLAEARLPAAELIRVIASRELNGSAHTILVAALPGPWSTDGAADARWLSVLFFALGVAVLYAGLARRNGPAAATTGLLLATCNPITLSTAWTGRGYAMAFLWGVMLWLSAARQIENRRRSDDILWGTLAATSAYVHFFLVPLCLAQWLFVSRERRWRRSDLPLAGAAIALLGWTPVAMFLIAGGDNGQLPDMPVPSLHDRIALLVDFLAAGFSGNRLGQFALVGVLGVGMLMALRTSAPRPRSHMWLGGVGCLAVLAATEAGSIVHPAMLTAKYLPIAASSLAAVVAVAAQTTSLRLQTVRRGLVAVYPLVLAVLTCSGLLLWGRAVMTEPSPGATSWTAAAQYAERWGTSSDVVTTMVPFEEHAARRVVLRTRLAIVPAAPATASEMLEASGYTDRDCLPAPPDGADVWLFSTQSPYLAQHLPGAARCSGLVVRSRAQIGFVTVIRLGRGR